MELVDIAGKGPTESQFPSQQSYSIEAEDLLLQTITLAVLKYYEKGSYLDMGSAHPILHSNTYLFYKKGWSGTCVEPNPEYVQAYREYRPRDKLFNVGIAPEGGSLRYHRFESKLINGFFDDAFAERHVQNGEKYLGHSDVECIGINDFLRSRISSPIEILNIDVETLDAKILGTWDWELCRPSMICAEIHTTDIRQMLREDVATILLRNGYSPMSRGWLSAIFVDNRKLEAAGVPNLL